MPKQDDDDLKKAKTDDEEVDTSQDEDDTDDDAEDEDLDDDAAGDDDDDADEDDDEGKTDDEDSDDDKSKFKKQFSSIKGDSLEEYTPNLEETYRKSSREGKRLGKENAELQGRLDAITAAVAKNPELAKLITEATGDDAVTPLQDPALLHAREQMNKTMETEYNEFVESHPEVDDDEKLQADLLEELKTLGAAYRAKGKVLGMGKGLELAWKSLGMDDGDSKEDIAAAAKRTAAKGKTNNGGKKPDAKKGGLTPDQIAYGKRFGLTEKQMLEFSKK